MAYKINEDTCVGCGACVSECPPEAIFEKDGKYQIDPAKCADCGVCVSTCPTEAIVAG